jgi:two-component system, OmpR family, alkaline phosphatase synthesis response regulator PhoP
MKICLIEDEQNIARLIAYDCKQAGYEITIFHDGQEAKQKGLAEVFDVFIIDWMLPGMLGIDLVKYFRAQNVQAIMMMLTAKDEEADILEAFEAGVDDYISKPFSPRELLARIKAHGKRLNTKSNQLRTYEDLSIDESKHRILIEDKAIDCTKKEYDLLTYMILNHDIVLSRDDILNQIWNFDYDGDTRIVDVHIFKLRSKLESSRCEIASVRGVGYTLQKRQSR